MQEKIDALSDHYIVCGYGRVGSAVVEEIEAEGLPVVVIDNDPGVKFLLEQKGVPYLQGDVANDEVLLSAGIQRAKGLVTALSMESTNVYVIQAARQLNPELFVVSRTDTESHIMRMERVGANRVVMPHRIGGVEMAYCVMRPGFHALDKSFWGREYDLDMDEFAVGPDSTVVGKSLGGSDIRSKFNLLVVAVSRSGQEPVFNPGADFEVLEGDTLLLVGRRQDLLGFRECM
jgi:voltage-gated potassium channel